MQHYISDKNSGFQWINVESHKAISKSIENGDDRDHIGSWVRRIFEQIADWYCGTQRAEVKKHLYDFISPDSNSEQKLSAFHQLRDMASEGHKEKFSQEISMVDINVLFLEIKIEGEPISIAVKINSESELIREKYFYKEIKMNFNNYKFITVRKEVNFKSIEVDGELVDVKNLYDLSIDPSVKMYSIHNKIIYELFLNRGNWPKLCDLLQLPAILIKVRPEFIDIKMKQDSHGGFSLVLLVKEKKYNKNFFDINAFCEVHSEITKHLRDAAIMDPYMYPVKNDEKIHSANLEITFYVRNYIFDDIKVRGKLSEYIGPECDFHDRTAVYKKEHEDEINKIRRSAFFLEESSGINLNSIEKIDAMQVDAPNDDVKNINNVFNKWIIDLQKHMAEIDEHNLQEILKPKPHKLRTFSSEFHKLSRGIKLNARWSYAYDQFKEFNLEYMEVFTHSINKLLSNSRFNGDLNISGAVYYLINNMYRVSIRTVGNYIDYHNDNKVSDDEYYREAAIMYVALNNGFLSIAKYFFKRYGNLVSPGVERNVTFLMVAIKLGDKKLVAELIRNYPDIKAVDESGHSVLFYAILYQNKEIIEHILYGVDESGDEISKKIELGYFSGLDSDNNDAMAICCRYLNLYSSEKPASMAWIFDSSNPDGPIFKKYGPEKIYIDLVGKMLDLGWGVHAKDSDGLTPVDYIQASGNRKLINRLLEIDNFISSSANTTPEKVPKEDFQILQAISGEVGAEKRPESRPDESD